MALENIPQAEVTENVAVESLVEPQQTEVSIEETAPIEQVPQDGPIKIKQSSLDAFTAKVKSNPDYDVFDAKADYPEMNFDDELFDAFAKYANTVIENKYTRETLNKKFTSSYGFEIDSEPPLGKQSPREATVGQSGVIESQSKESKPTEPIVVEPTKAQQIVGGSAEQVALELAEKRVASKETKQGLPQGYVKKDGVVIPDEKTRKDFQIYEGSALNYKQAQDSQGKNFKKIPGVGMIPQLPTEDDVKSLKNKERQSEVYSKKIAPKVQELADLITEGDSYFQFLELKKDDKGQVKSYTLNPYQANEIASKYATSYGLPSDGYFSKFLENQILSAAEYKYKEAKAEPFFEQNELPKLKKKYPEAFSETAMLNTFLSWSKKDDAIFAEQKQKIENIANELTILKDAELKPFLETYESDAKVLIDADLKEQELLKAKLSDLQNQVNAGLDFAQAQAIESQYKEEYAQKKIATDEQLTSLWGKFSDTQNQISGKYQRRLDRHIKESEAFIQSELTDELKTFAKGIYENPRFIADFKAARQRAFAATGLEKMTYEQNIERGYSVADAFSKSTNKILGSSLEAYGSMFGADWMRLYGKQVAAETIISPAKMDEWSDALNLFNAAKLTGQLAGVMLPSIGAGVATTYLTGGLGLPTIVQGAINLAAGSLASFTVNSFDVANRMYVDEFNKDGNVASALKKSNKMFEFEMGEYEYHLFDSAPYVNVFAFSNPFVRGAVLGGISFLTENLQEQRESLAEEAIRGNVDPYLHIGRSIDNVGKVLKNKFGQYEFLSKAERDEAVKSYRNSKSISISVSPMFFGAGISGYGQAQNDAYKRDRASEEGIRLFQEHIINEKSDYKALRQQLGTIAMEKGVAFATMIANTMYQKAQIQTKVQYTSVLNSIKAADELMKSPTIQKMKRADRSIYLTLADAYQRSVINSETETDPIQKEAIQKQLKEIKDEMEMFATTKKTNTIQLTLNDGTIYFFLPSELSQALSESNELIEFITSGMATISALNTELTPKQKEIFANISEQINQYEASKAPVVPGTVTEDVELTKEQKDNIKKVEIPKFASYEDALSFIQERAIVYGSEANFKASEEYAELFPVIKDLYDTEQEIRTATTPEEALKIVEQKGLKPGDKVTLESTNFQGKPITLTGTVAVLNGSPIINLDSNQSTMSGEVVVRINNNWKKSEENAVQEQTAGKVPVQPESEVSGEMAQGKPQAEPQITAEEGQAKAKPEKEKVTVTRASDEEMSAGNQEMDSANIGETITTTKPSRIYKGTFGKRNPDGSIRSAHPDVKGSFGSTNKAIATKYKGNEPFKAFDIPAGTTVEIIKSDKFGEGISIARQDETDRINNSTAQIVRLDTTDNGGRQSQYIIKDKTLIDNGYLVDEEVVSEEAQVAPETEAQAEQATTEEKASKAKQTRLDNLRKALRRKLGIPLGSSVPIYVNINNIDSVIRMAERSGAEQLTKILKDAKKIIIATGKNNTSVVVHNNQSSYTASVLNLGGQAQQSLSNGFFIDRNGNSIHINLPTLQANNANETVLHEGAHPLLEYLIQTDPNAIENLYKQLEALEKDMPDVKRALDFGRGYADPIVSKKEAIVQFLALTANGDIKLDELPQTIVDKILNFVKNLLATLGINFEMEINTADDLITVAQKFTFAVENARQIIKDNKISQSPQNNPSFSTVDPNFVTRDGTKIGFIYDRDVVARERFNIDNLERISSGSDRVVFDLGNGMVVKIAKTPRGLAQNIYEGDYYLSERGVIPEIYERGLNYNVVQKVDSPKANKQISEMLREFQRFTQKDFDNKTPKIQEVLEKYGFDEVLNYDILWNDFTRRVNWGVASDGRPIHLDGGTFGGVKMIEQYKGVKAMSDEDFRDVYLKSKEAKRALGETKSKYPQFSKASNVENKLIEFIEEQRNQGQSDEDITEALQNEGYGDAAIEKAFAGISMAPSGVKPKKRKGKEEGTKINEVWERLAKTYEEEGNAEAAEYIRTNGRYGVRKQRDVYDIARKIFFDQNNESFEMSLRQIEEERFPDDLKVALYGVALENEVAKKPSLKRSKEISYLMEGFAKLGTNYGQAVSMFQYVYQRVPELFYEAKEAEHIASVYAVLGNPDAIGTTGNKIKRAAVPKIKAIRKEALSSISAALNGLLPVEALFDPKNRYFLSDNKMLNSLKVLLDYGQQLDDTEKTMLKNMVAKMVEGEWAETEADARRIIKANLNDLNGKLRTPFTSDEINTLTSEMITMFLNIAFKGVKTKNEKAFKSKKDIFNQIANVIAEKSDAVILLGNNKEGKPSLTGRMKRGLSILLGKTAEDKTVLSEMMKRLVDGGFVEKAKTKAEAEEFIRQELESRNPELQTPLSDTELDEMAAAFVDLYEEIATERIKDALDNILKPPATKQKKTKRDKVVQAVLYGVLDDVDAFNKFAQMFGVATITPQQQDELRQAAEDVQNAKTQGATAYAQALSNFNSTFANIQLQGKVGMAKVLGTIGKGGWFVESVIYNNILSSINTLLRAGTGNVQKVLREFGYAAIKGDIDVIKKAFQESINKSTYNQVPIIDQSGRTIYVDVDLNQFFDNLYSSLRGLPRLSEVKRSGLNETELKIRLMTSGTKKNLVRFFTTPASRSLSAIDSASTPFVELLTKRQLYMAVLKQAYKDADIYKTRLELMGMVDELLEPSNQEIEKAIAKAREDVINGPLYKQLGMTSFPDVDPRMKSKKFSKESKVYNEFIQRIYEILDEESVQRAANVAERYQWDSMFDVGNVIREIDDLSSKTASEITYLGQPRGTFGGFAQTLANISNKAPVLKYFGITPMFTNASMNAASYLIKLTPGINAIQYVSYQIKGQRGLFKNPKALFDKSLRQQDYINKPILTYDQKKMRDNVIFTNALAVALIAMLTGDDEEKRRKWKEGKGTGFTPIVLSDAQKSLGLKPGVFYYNGEPMVEYKDSAFQPFYAAVAFITNSVIDDVFTTDPFSRQPFQTETRTPEDEDFLEMMANYSLFTMLTAAESSTLKSISETVTDIMKIISTPEEKSTAEVDKVRKEEYGKLFAKKGANFLSMFIPYKRLGGEANSIVSAMMGKNKKKSIEWQDQIFKNTMLERWMLQSEQTDYYGRPIKETFRFVNPFFFLVQIGDEFSGTNYERPEDYGYGDKYLMLFGRQNYSPRSSIGDIVPFPYNRTEFINSFPDNAPRTSREMSQAEREQIDADISTADGSSVTYQEFMENKEKEFAAGDKRIFGIENVDDETILINYKLEPQEAYLINRKKGEFVYDVVSYEATNELGEKLSNFEVLKDLEPLKFRRIMDSLYQLGRNVAIRNNIRDFTMTRQDEFDLRIMTSLFSLQREFGALGLLWPEKLELDKLLIDRPAGIENGVLGGEFKFK
jgi:hypothetical protein